MFERFRNRQDAGQRLASALSAYENQPNTQVLALPRGGVPVAYEVARELSLPLDVLLVRKLGVPGQEELAMGAIAWDHIRILNNDIIRMLGISDSDIETVTKKEQQELMRRNKLYRDDKQPPTIEGQTIIVVDDGLATGATMKAAVATLVELNAEKIIVAIPVGAHESVSEVRAMADEVICLHMPDAFFGVGYWYADFSQTSDAEVQELLSSSK